MALLLTGCNTLSSSGTHGINTLRGAESANHDNPYGLPLESGQILLAEEGIPGSVLWGLIPGEYFPFVHTGILVIEDDDFFVYEARAHVFPVPGRAPTTTIFGTGIQRMPLRLFVKRSRYVEIYQPGEDINVAKVVRFAKERLDSAAPFDVKFDYRDRETLYCSEFVAVALEEAGGEPAPLVPKNANPSLGVLLNWLEVDFDRTIPAAPLVNGMDFVGALGTWDSPVPVDIFMEVKRELYRRFTPDQRLGNLFRYERGKIEYREPVADFVETAVKLFPHDESSPPREVIRSAVLNLADEMLGPFEG